MVYIMDLCAHACSDISLHYSKNKYFLFSKYKYCTNTLWYIKNIPRQHDSMGEIKSN